MIQPVCRIVKTGALDPGVRRDDSVGFPGDASPDRISVRSRVYLGLLLVRRFLHRAFHGLGLVDGLLDRIAQLRGFGGLRLGWFVGGWWFRLAGRQTQAKRDQADGTQRKRNHGGNLRGDVA